MRSPFSSPRYDKRRLHIIARNVVGDDVLDIGYAALPNPFLKNCHRVGYDLMEKPNFETNYEEHITGDVKDISIKLRGRAFDTVISGELIEHLENPYQFLRDVRGLIRPNGRFILSTPNPAGFPVFIVELFRIKRFFYTQGHTYYFLPRWVERLLDRSGFKLIKSEGVGLWLPIGVIPFVPQILCYQIVYLAGLRE
jgi:SAM-dependent methyltransferase